jgi:Acetyltransferase (GNAT) family
VVPAWTEVEASFDILKDCGIELGASLGAFGGKLSDTVPGIRGSVAFLSILRSNIQLSTGAISASPRVQPISAPSAPVFSLLALQLPEAPTMAARASDGSPISPDRLATVPELVYETPTSSSSRLDGLKLVADSVAQIHQVAAATIIGSPPSLAFMMAVPMILYLLMYRQSSDYFRILLTTAGAIMSLLVSVRMVLRGYIEQAEAIDWKWFGDDYMLIARFGGDVIGVLVYHIRESDQLARATTSGTSAPTSRTSRRGNNKSTVERIAEIRAWTIRRRERGHGVGMALLETAVKRCLQYHQCNDVVFADVEGGRAGSKQVLSPILAGATNLNNMFIRDKKRGQIALRKVVEQAQGLRK